MNGYLCYYNGKKIEVLANSSYEAQSKAAVIFKPKKRYQVIVELAETNVSDSQGEK